MLNIAAHQTFLPLVGYYLLVWLFNSSKIIRSERESIRAYAHILRLFIKSCTKFASFVICIDASLWLRVPLYHSHSWQADTFSISISISIRWCDNIYCFASDLCSREEKSMWIISFNDSYKFYSFLWVAYAACCPHYFIIVIALISIQTEATIISEWMPSSQGNCKITKFRAKHTRKNVLFCV